MVMNLVDVKHYIKIAVLDKLDHKNLDKDVPEFQGVVSTTENVAVFVWNSLIRHGMPKNVLHEVVVHETENNVFRFRGEYDN